jgi:transporter family-2 protein
MRSGIAALVIVGGLGLAVQAALNSRLRAGVQSPILGALISFLVGSAALGLVYAAGWFGRGRLTEVGTLPWWAWAGGLCGALYVAVSTVAVPRIGTALVIACAVLGQLVAALALDSFGWLGVPKVPLNGWRVLGAVFLLAGVVLMQRKG